MVVLIDNYDSFVHNLARYARELGHRTVVVRNDAADPDAVAALAPSHLILSPGPCTPGEAGICQEAVLRFGASVPVLGVCLGHQCIAAAFGGRIVPAERPAHGKDTTVRHQGAGVFHGLANPFRAGLYHSLAVDPAALPACLEPVAWDPDGAIMALRHREWPVWGVQFHPESVLTEGGHALLGNFLRLGSNA